MAASSLCGLAGFAAALGATLAAQRLVVWAARRDHPCIPARVVVADVLFRCLAWVCGVHSLASLLGSPPTTRQQAQPPPALSCTLNRALLEAICSAAEPLRWWLLGDFRVNEATVSFTDALISGVDGLVTAIRVYTPPSGPDGEGKTEAEASVLLYLHGGGFTALHPQDHACDAVCRNFARLGLVVVAVDYRLAPEDPFPAALTDTYSVMRWCAPGEPAFGLHGEALLPAGRRLLLGGDDAGGNLALVLGLLAANNRDAGGGPSRLGPVEVAQLVLLQPTLCLRSSHSRLALRDAWFLPRPVAESCEAMYLGPAARARRHDWRVCPLRAPAAMLAKLPPLTVLTSTLDPLRDEGEQLVALARHNGVDCEHIDVRGAPHGLLYLGPDNRLASAFERILAGLLGGVQNHTSHILCT